MPTLSPTPVSGWQRFANGSVRLFHDYANWLVGISWKRFFLLSVLLLIATGIFSSLLPNWTVTEVHDSPVRPRPPKPPAPPTVSKDSQGISINIQKDGKGSGKDDFTIQIDQNGVRIGPLDEDRITGFIPGFEREDRGYQGTAGEGVAVDADGVVFAAEGPNSIVQAGGAFTKYSPK